MINSLSNKKPVVWTISGSDSGGGAGIQADLLSFQDFGVHGCSVVTALTAQNSFAVGYTIATERKNVVAQINALDSDMPADAIKVGMLLNTDIAETVAKYLNDYQGFVVCDPVVMSSTGGSLLEDDAGEVIKRQLLPRVDLLTPDFSEAQALTGINIQSPADMELVAKALLEMGVRSVIITGGLFSDLFDGEDARRLDFWSNGEESFWLSGENIKTINDHGSGCTFSSAVAAVIVRGFSLPDALVIAKAYTTQGIRHAEQLGSGPGPVGHYGWPDALEDFPELSAQLSGVAEPFPACGSELGLCPVVGSLDELKGLLDSGISSLRLQLVGMSESSLKESLAEAINLCGDKQIRLFIEHHWRLAIALKAYGVHLGQEALEGADEVAICEAGLCLGVSVSSLAELAKIHALRASYVEVGPVFGDQGLGLDQLEEWVELLEEEYLVVAAGGVGLANVAELMTTGVDGVVVGEAINSAGDSLALINDLIELVSE